MESSFVLLRVVNTLTGVLGVLGNCLVSVVIISERSMHTNTNALILHQAAIDFFACTFILLYEYIPRNDLVPQGVSGQILCVLWNSRYFLLTFFVASTYSLLAVTFERFFAIVHPYRYERHASSKKGVGTVIACVWAIVLSFRVYALSQWTVDEGGTCSSQPNGSFLAVVIFLLQYAIPLSLMTYMYIRIGLEISRSAKRIVPTVSESAPEHNRNHQGESLFRARRNTFKALLTVFVTFVLCWSLNQVIFFMHNMGWQAIDFSSAIYIVSVALIALNTCVNPFIYAFKYKTFQQALRRLLYRVTGRFDRLNFTAEIPLTSQASREETASP